MNLRVSLLSMLLARGAPPCLMQLLEVLKGPLGDVESWVDLPQIGLSNQRQTAQPKVGMKRIWERQKEKLNLKGKYMLVVEL